MHRLGGASLEALEERGVLAVDGQEEPSPTLARRERELACGDEALLVGEREGDAALESPERGRQAREADDCVEDDVGLGSVEERREVAADLGVLDSALRGEVVELVRARGERAGIELWIGVDDLERLTPDRPRGAENRDPLHDQSVRVSL